MPTLKNRLTTAEQTASPKVAGFNVWSQDTCTDLFTCPNVPGVELTEEELEARPVPEGVRRIVVAYDD